MPNHYTNVLHVFPGHRDDDERDLRQELADRKWGDKPLQRVCPMPVELEGTTSPSTMLDPDLIEKHGADNWYDWQRMHRGIKWDAYDVEEPMGLPGDCGAVQLTFCTAWRAPNQAVCEALSAELLNDYGADRVVWLGLNPFDGSFEVVGQWEWSPVRLRVVQ